MLLELLAVGLLLCSGDTSKSNGKHSSIKNRYTSPSPIKKRDYYFEEADSFFDKDGNEHIVDYEGYCEECDDYHDEY